MSALPTNKMKILRIIARLNVGGPARHVIWLTEGLKPDGFETLLVAGIVPPGEDDMSYVAAASGVQPFTLPEMSREISLKDALTIWKLFRLMRREQPDIVHTHTAKAGTVGRVAGLMYRWLTPATLIGRPRACRFVHTYHGHVFHSYYGRVKTRLFLGIERLLARLATDRIVVVSTQQLNEINETFRVGQRKQFAVIPLGIDLGAYASWRDRRSQMRRELDLTEQEVLVGIVGRVTEIKNHDLFLRMAALYKEHPGAHPPVRPRRVRFVVIGDGHLRPGLEAQARALNLTDEVVFAGTRKDPEFFYPALDVVALTSRNEGTPLTLIEAMLNARPVIATAVGGVVDLLGPAAAVSTQVSLPYTICERGIRVSPNDANGFAAALTRLIEDEELRITTGERAREFIEQNYAKDRLLDDIMGLYRELLCVQPVTVDPRPSKRSLESRV